MFISTNRSLEAWNSFFFKLKYDAWFMLGSAAFRSEKWETAIKAFRFCTNLDPDVNIIF